MSKATKKELEIARKVFKSLKVTSVVETKTEIIIGITVLPVTPVKEITINLGYEQNLSAGN